MKKDEAEVAIRNLARIWMREKGLESSDRPSFFAFKAWLSQTGNDHYLTFQLAGKADPDAETWFRDELKQKRRG